MTITRCLSASSLTTLIGHKNLAASFATALALSFTALSVIAPSA